MKFQSSEFFLLQIHNKEKHHKKLLQNV